MTNAADRLALLDQLPATELCDRASVTLTALVDIMNKETVLLRTGHAREASTLTADKTQLAQDYVVLARAVQRQGARLSTEAPELLAQLRAHHESFATQMAENLRVLATAKSLTETLLTDVAKAVGQNNKPHTYGANGRLPSNRPTTTQGLSVNRAL